MTGIPHVVIDGKISIVGAQQCPLLKQSYQEGVDAQIEAWGGLSPIEITGGLAIVDDTATITATFTLVDPGYTFDAHQATLFLYEDDVFWCCGYGGVDRWDEVVRMVRSTPLSLTQQGQEGVVIESIDVTGFDPYRLRAVALFEEIGAAKEIIQATDFTFFESSFAPVASVPAGTGEAILAGEFQNIAAYDDTIDLWLDDGFGWPAEFQVDGDPNWYTTYTLALPAGASGGCLVRVQTDGEVRVGSGNLVARSQITGQTQVISLDVFNGTPAILVVDDDGVFPQQPDLPGALTARGYLHNRIDVEILADGPTSDEMSGYDVVIWDTGSGQSTLNLRDFESLQRYLDGGGGGLFLWSMEYLSDNGANSFTRDYLGVESYVLQARANAATGVAGDPISDAMEFPDLEWQGTAFNKPDVVHPTADASIILRKETAEPVALRSERPNGARVVFNTVLLTAFGDEGVDPNNLESLVARTVGWIAGGAGVPTDAPADLAVAARSRITSTQPNPFSPTAELELVLSSRAAPEPISLVVLDASGRRVRHLAEGKLPAGRHLISWDGRDDAGRESANGLYFAILRTADGRSVAKLTRLR